MECWGAQGGGNSDYPGGKGSYTSGTLSLSNSKTFYIVVGQNGSDIGTIFNNGSITIYSSGVTAPNDKIDWPGGGSTDIRLNNGAGDWTNFESRKSRIMVAASGGGSKLYHFEEAGKPGGALTGFAGTSQGPDGVAATEGSQISAGLNGTGCWSSEYVSKIVGFGYIYYCKYSVNGAGNGYYCGGQGNHGRDTTGVGATGSCFISGYSGCNAIKESSTEDAIVHTGNPNHYSGYVFTNTQMIAGNASMPSPSGGTETGHSGHGVCVITQLSF